MHVLIRHMASHMSTCMGFDLCINEEGGGGGGGVGGSQPVRRRREKEGK